MSNLDEQWQEIFDPYITFFLPTNSSLSPDYHPEILSNLIAISRSYSRIFVDPDYPV
jgi:hypothetical protein